MAKKHIKNGTCLEKKRCGATSYFPFLILQEYNIFILQEYNIRILQEYSISYYKDIELFLSDPARCLQANLLAGGLLAGALPGLALAADKRAQHTHATQKSTAHARQTKRDVWVCTWWGGAAHSIAAVISRVSISLCGAGVLCSFVWCACAFLCEPQAPDRAAHLQASPQPRD